jgi:short-subunit dehydrogenase
MLNLSLKLQQELAGTGVRIQCVMPGAVRTGMWDKAGIDIVRALPAEALMEPDDMVDAALAGLDSGEDITVPALPDRAEWEAFEAARRVMLPHLSRAVPALRYLVPHT